MSEAYSDRPSWPGPEPEPWHYRRCHPWLAGVLARQTEARNARTETPAEAVLRRKNERDRARAPLYVRFGDLPARGVSSTWRRMWESQGRRDLARILEGDFEAGVSCFRGRRVEGGYEVLPGSVDQAAVFRTFKRQERPAYLIEGREAGVGVAFEPVLEDARIVERIDPGRITAVGIWADLGMLLASPAEPVRPPRRPGPRKGDAGPLDRQGFCPARRGALEAGGRGRGVPVREDARGGSRRGVPLRPLPRRHAG